MKKPLSGFLKFIIAYKAAIGLIQLAVSVSLLRCLEANAEATFTRAAVSLNLDPRHELVSAAIKKAGGIENTTLLAIILTVLFLSVLNLIEAWGLHLRRRWAEWLTVFATGALIPYEIYEMFKGVTILKTSILVINVTIVYYLAKHKELFKRGGPGRLDRLAA